jgi:epoxyqueuosine reductase
VQQHNDFEALKQYVKQQALELGFEQCGIAPTDIREHVDRYRQWLAQNYYGDMEYMKSREALRSNIQELVPGTLSVISVRLNYVPQPARFTYPLESSHIANISRYALGRDYHKLMRKKLKQLGQRLKLKASELEYRVFVDSGPVLERAYAEKAGLGWIGKNSLVINEQAGSFFFLGELLTNLPLPPDSAPANQCGSCSACLSICPTKAIVEPYTVDATRCISYLTIEHFGSIDEELRPLMGNRIYGCDDCQLVCPWNRYATATREIDFLPRNNFDNVTLLELFAWSEQEFLNRTEGSPIRRIGYERWQRNIAVALGNAAPSTEIIHALNHWLIDGQSALVKEHVLWAIKQQRDKASNRSTSSQEPPQNKQRKEQNKLLRATEKIVGHLN